MGNHDARRVCAELSLPTHVGEKSCIRCGNEMAGTQILQCTRCLSFCCAAYRPGRNHRFNPCPVCGWRGKSEAFRLHTAVISPRHFWELNGFGQ